MINARAAKGSRTDLKREITIRLRECYPFSILLTIVLLLLTGGCEKTRQHDSHLSPWEGTYEGTAHHWSSYPGGNPMDPFIENNSYEKVQVIVEQSAADSCLNLRITYSDTVTETRNDLAFSVSGTHQSQWGGGSGYGSLEVRFAADGLHYTLFQKCGIPCSSGTDFVAARLR
jgi:hypothetical protein